VVLSVTKEEKGAIKYICSIEGITLKEYLTKIILCMTGGNNEIDYDIPIPAKSKKEVILIKKED